MYQRLLALTNFSNLSQTKTTNRVDREKLQDSRKRTYDQIDNKIIFPCM